MPHIRPAGESGPTRAAAPPDDNGDRPANVATRQEYRRVTFYERGSTFPQFFFLNDEAP